MENLKHKNYIGEAEKLLNIIEENKIKKQEDYLFVQSAKARVKVLGFFSEKQIFWLRDVLSRQLEED